MRPSLLYRFVLTYAGLSFLFAIFHFHHETTPITLVDKNLAEQYQDISHDLTNTTVFFHLGKAGGGTVYRLLDELDIKVNPCHPDPNKCGKFFRRQSPKKELRPIPRALISIRDPVDRFQSAFNWRALAFCHAPDQDKRNRTDKKKQYWDSPDEYCLIGEKLVEKRVLLNTYHSSVNSLAERLCDDNEVALIAKNDTRYIKHLKYSLADWFNTMGIRIENESDNNYATKQLGSVNQVYPLVMDRNLSVLEFEKLVENSLKNLVAVQSGTSKEDVQTMFDIKKKLLKQNYSSIESMYMHSASASHKETGFVPEKLTPLGQCCVARFLRKDYMLIQAMVTGTKNGHEKLSSMCDSWGDAGITRHCREGLASMMARREPFFRNLDIPCRRVVTSFKGEM